VPLPGYIWHGHVFGDEIQDPTSRVARNSCPLLCPTRPPCASRPPLPESLGAISSSRLRNHFVDTRLALDLFSFQSPSHRNTRKNPLLVSRHPRPHPLLQRQQTSSRRAALLHRKKRQDTVVPDNRRLIAQSRPVTAFPARGYVGCGDARWIRLALGRTSCKLHRAADAFATVPARPRAVSCCTRHTWTRSRCFAAGRQYRRRTEIEGEDEGSGTRLGFMVLRRWRPGVIEKKTLCLHTSTKKTRVGLC
jgi:hypothetical protein